MHFSLWGKSRPYHPLWCHFIDVGCVATVLWREVFSETFRLHLAALLGLTVTQTERLVIWLGALHDLGKATPGFQALDIECAKRVHAVGLRTISSAKPMPHGIATACALTELLEKSWSRHVRMAAVASGGHHGELFSRVPEGFGYCTDEKQEKLWNDARLGLVRFIEEQLDLSTPDRAPTTAGSLTGLSAAMDIPSHRQLAPIRKRIFTNLLRSPVIVLKLQHNRSRNQYKPMRGRTAGRVGSLTEGTHVFRSLGKVASLPSLVVSSC